MALIQIPLHEAAHWIACLGLGGHGCVLGYNIALGSVSEGWQRGIQIAAGPFLGLLLCLVAVHFADARRTGMVTAALCVVCILGFRSIALGSIYFGNRVWKDRPMGFDEVFLAEQLRAPPSIVVLVSMGLFLLLLGMMLRRGFGPLLPSWLLCITTGGFLGTFVWIHWLGPALLPW